jgi:Dolichyl-phosphate-mannose-protein mannosyltransferase
MLDKNENIKKRFLNFGVGLIILTALILLATIKLEEIPPVWWDEGWNLCVARNWVEIGHYGCLLVGEKAPPSLAGSIWSIAPAALGFKLLGIGVWQGRIAFLLITAGVLVLLYLLAYKLYNQPVAIVTLILLLFLPIKWQTDFINIGRQAIGEMPMLLFLLAGYICFLNIEKKPWLFLSLTIVFGGLAMMTKIQAQPFWILSLLAALLLTGIRRQWRLIGLLLVTLIGSIVAWQLFKWGQHVLLSPISLPRSSVNMSSLTVTIALVPPNSSYRYYAIRSLLSSLPVVLGLAYAGWRWFMAYRQKEPLNATMIVHIMMLVLCGSWFSWFVLLSNSDPRYSFPPLTIAAIFLAALLSDLSNGFKLREMIESFFGLLKTRQLSNLPLKSGGAIILIIIMVMFALRATILFPHWKGDTSAIEVANYFNTSTPADSIIETYDSELFFLLDRPYHYPPNQVYVQIMGRLYQGKDAVVEYDPLSADPDFLVIGNFSSWFELYQPILDTGAFRRIKTIGHYEIFERVR